MNRKYVYIGQMPDIGGYGINVVSLTEEGAMKALKSEYYSWRKSLKSDRTFKDACEYFGGGVDKITLDKGYYGDFGY
jgi:hypothetical protein